MTSREQMLADVLRNQPDLRPMDHLPEFQVWFDDCETKFSQVLTMIGGHLFAVPSLADVAAIIREHYPQAARVVSNVSDLVSFAERLTGQEDPHSLETVDVAILEGQFGVAENGAIWVTENMMSARVLPFICQNLVLIIPRGHIVATMHDAYEKIGNANYGYGSFIAGPSKTADIEQSLVLGAHGPKSMSVLLVG